MFRAPYDDSVDADVFAGDPKGHADGPVVFEPGRFGQAVAVGEQFARLRYTMASHGHAPNLDGRRGSLSFHFKAEDWKPSEPRSHLLFKVTSLALMRVFTDEQGLLVFETGSDLGQRLTVRASLSDKRQDEWIHVVATWSPKRVRLYVDGKLAAEERGDDRFVSYAVNTTFEVGDIARGAGREAPRKTLIDDLTIYRRPLEPDELGRVEAPPAAGTAPEYEPPAVTVPRARAAPRIDGSIDGDEWTGAAQLTNFASVSDHKLAPVRSTAWVTHDSERVYVAVVSPILPGVALTKQRTKRDDSVWQDDAVQIYLTVPSGNRFLFIGNSIGAIYDRRYQKGTKDDVTWDGRWQYATKTVDRAWTAEVSIAFADLGVSSPAKEQTWRLNVTRDRVDPGNLSAWAAVSNYSDTARHGHLTFTDDGPVVTGAPDASGVVGRRVDIAAVIDGSSLRAPTTVDVEWIAAAAGRIVGSKTQRTTVGPRGQATARFESTFPVALDALTFTARDAKTDHVLYRQTSVLSRRDAVGMSFSPRPARGTCSIDVSIGDPGVAAMKPSAQIDLVPQEGRMPVATMSIEQFSEGRGRVEFDLNELEPGTYDVRTQLTAYGRTVAKANSSFTKPDEPWRGTTLGLSDRPPPPWPPIEARVSDGEAPDPTLNVRCWNRTYVFDASPLPTSIDNGGAAMLTGPARVEATVDGRVEKWSRRSLDVTHRDMNQVVFETKQRGEALVLSARTTVEFDGMSWTDMTIEPEGEPTVDRIDLVIPIADAHAKYRHWPGDVALTGRLGWADGWSWAHALPKYAYSWIGDDDLGLTWFFETWGQFRHADEKSTVELVRRDGALQMLIRYVGAPVRMTEPLKIAFGLQATPTRPRPVGWRSWGGGNTLGTNVSVLWASEEVHRYGAGYPEATNPDYYRRVVKGMHERGETAVPYNGILWSANFSPEMQYNAADWDLGGGINKYSDHRRFWWGRRICGAASSYSEFFTWKANRHIDRIGIDGLYHDLQWSYRCGSTDHGYDEPHRSIRGDRALNRRIYTMMKQFGRPLIKFDHASNFVCSVTSPFSDLFTTGEEMRRYPPEGDHPDHKVSSNYFHNMRLDYFKACGATGRQWGVAPCLLTQMTANDVPRSTESLYAILVPHDAIPTWEALLRNVRYQRRVQRTVQAFGIGAADVEFLPYWHETTPARVSFTPDGGGPIRPQQVVYEVPEIHRLLPEEATGASVYRRHGRRSLVAVFNYTMDDGTMKVDLDLAELGLSGERVLATDAFTRMSWVRADRTIELAVPSLNYRLILVERLDAPSYAQARIAETFPPVSQERMLAGYHPDAPRNESVGVEVAGDRFRDPRKDGEPSRSGPQRSELMQTFTLDAPARIHRVELYMTDSPGAFAVRTPVRIALVGLGEDGLPSDRIVASTSDFAATWVDDRTWSYRLFEMLESKMLDPGRYALVLSKPAEDPSEYFHARFTAVDADRLPGEHIAFRNQPDHRRGAFEWSMDRTKVLCFGVYGFK
ncbi:MAG: hypothetical protein CMJ18_07250 [Phycisphaeraceae bacterium]|nr:hypothetical protein [Phycisphaeraceae bacterium]